MDADAEGEEEVDLDKFFDTCTGSASVSSASAGSTCHRHWRPESDDMDMEDDPLGPVTPGPNSRFDIVVPTSRPRPRPLLKPPQQPSLLPPPLPTKHHVFPSHSSSSLLSPAAPPPMLHSKSLPLKKSNSGKTKKNKKQIPVPVTPVKLSTQQPKECYLLPIAPIDDPSGMASHHAAASCNGQQGKQSPAVGASTTENRMHTVRARDGGRHRVEE